MEYILSVKNYYYLDKTTKAVGLDEIYSTVENNYKGTVFESTKDNNPIIKIGDWKWEIQKHGNLLQLNTQRTDCCWTFSTNYRDTYVLKVFHPNEKMPKELISHYQVIQQFNSMI